MKYISKNLKNTQEIAKDFVLKLLPQKSGATVVGLYGELGAGKTSFTQGVAKAFNLQDTITSPTFVIEKIYPIRTNGRRRPISNRASEFEHLIHIDAYRLEKSQELLHLGWKEIIADSKNLILVEWPEKVADIMPKHTKIRLKTLDSGESREIEVLN
jgi:tRNA threonylcarbamoyladenosine biosynthesis protein TsaE